MREDEISILPAVAKLQRSWLLVVLAAILGGLIGWGSSLIRPPEYASSAVLGIGIDYGRTHPLSREAQRHAMNRVRALILSDDVLTAALEGSSLEGPRELRKHLSLEERESEWSLVARSQDPQAAAEWANAWAESALNALKQALLHAIRAEELQNELFEVGCTLRPSSEADRDALWDCSLSRPGTVEQVELELLEEAELSRGILPGLSMAMLREATPEQATSRPERGVWIVVGVLLGLVAGLALVTVRT